MRAAIRTTNPKPRHSSSLQSTEDPVDSGNPFSLPGVHRTLDEASLRSLLSLFELLDRWDLEGKSHEA